MDPDTGPGGAREAAPAPRSGRLRRLRLTAVVLGVAAVVGAAVATALIVGSREKTYRPGEELDEITATLARNLPDDAPSAVFVDVTEEAGLGDFVNFAGNRTSQLPEDMGCGAAWGDFDGDGDDDLFLVSAGGALDAPPETWAPSRLYENRGDGTFRAVTGFPEIRIIGMGAAWGDVDGDGRPDLAVTGFNTIRLFRNTEAGFVPVESLPSPDGFWTGVSWADYDRDGDLDLYVCGYVRYAVPEDVAQRPESRQYGALVPYTLNPASFEPERNLLFRNDGDSFTEVAEQLGVANVEGRSLGALWHDLDDDGRLDLYLANDISDNALYLNAEGVFEDVSHAAWVADYRGAMGLAAGDWNRDGDEDLFVTHWIAQENALYDSLAADLAERAEDTSGETPASAGLRFMDVADNHGLGQTALQAIGWGAEFADLDADGWLDLVVANGSTFEDDATPPRLEPQPDFLLWNRRGEYFHDLAPFGEALAESHVGRGLAVADYDLDGDLDLLFVDLGEGVRLLRNDTPQGRWIQLRLRPANGRSPEGARVVARAGDAVLRRSVGGVSYLSQSSRTVHVGLGASDRADVEVLWPGGGRSVFGGLEAGFVWTLREGDGEPERVSLPSSPSGAPVDERERIRAFWAAQRGGMDALKIENDPARAIGLFREALRLDPDHEDALYYLASALAQTGDVEGALSRLRTLTDINPQSHRGWREWGSLRARNVRSPRDLADAGAAVEKALALNPEETGALLLLGEIGILSGQAELADERLALACRTNQRAVGGFFLRGYLAWRGGDKPGARALLERARAALGEDWKPEGTTAEGDVRREMASDISPLSRFWNQWDGVADPDPTFRAIDAFLAGGSGARPRP